MSWEFLVHDIEQVFPQPYAESEERRVGRMRFSVGLSARLLETLLTEPLARVSRLSYERAVTKQRSAQREEDRYAEATPSGVYMALEVVRE